MLPRPALHEVLGLALDLGRIGKSAAWARALSGVDVLWQEFAVGFLIIVAVALDQWLRRVSA